MDEGKPFEELDAEEQARIFRTSSLRDKRELLPRCHELARITRSLSYEEVYLITREMDLEEKSEVLAHATREQLFFISDIECWRHDRLHGENFLSWLEVLKESDDQKLLDWLLMMDYEMIVAGLQKVIHVLKPEREYATDEVLGDTPYFTLDNYYYIASEEENLETVKRVLEVLYENHRGRYAALMEGVIGEIDNEVEEEAFRKREIRLSELGFPDIETARRVYRRMSDEELKAVPEKRFGREKPEEGLTTPMREALPNYLVLWEDNKLFLDQVLGLFQEEPARVREALEEELAFLSNKVVAAESTSGIEEEKIHFGVARTRALLSLGLEILSGGDLLAAREILKKRWAEHIFRTAITRVVEIRDRAEILAEGYWQSRYKSLIHFLRSPYEEIFGGIFRSVPQCYDPEASEESGKLRDFRTTMDLERTLRSIEQVAAIHEFVEAVVPGFWHKKRETLAKSWEDMSLVSVLGTLFASWTTRGKPSLSPFNAAQVREFLEAAFEQYRDSRYLSPQVKQRFLGEYFSNNQLELIRPLWGILFEEIESEFSRLNVTQDLDLRFISVVWTMPHPTMRQRRH